MNIESRITNLELSNRNLKISLAVILAIVGCVFVLGQAAKSPEPHYLPPQTPNQGTAKKDAELIEHSILGMVFDIYEDGVKVDKKVYISLDSKFRDGKGYVHVEVIWVLQAPHIFLTEGFRLEPHHCSSTEGTIKDITYSKNSLICDIYPSKKTMPNFHITLSIKLNENGMHTVKGNSVYKNLAGDATQTIEWRQAKVTELKSNKLFSFPFD